MKKYAIVIPAGSGKTTISNKYKNIYDIDQFHSQQNRIDLAELYKQTCITNDWNKYNLYEVSIIKDKINKLNPPYIILLHCDEKTKLLNLTCLGSFKTDEKTMDYVATKRGKTNKLLEIMTRNNWKNCNAKIFNSHKEIEDHIINLAKIHNIKS